MPQSRRWVCVNRRSLIGAVVVMARFRQSMPMNDRNSQSDPWKCNCEKTSSPSGLKSRAHRSIKSSINLFTVHRSDCTYRLLCALSNMREGSTSVSAGGESRELIPKKCVRTCVETYSFFRMSPCWRTRMLEAPITVTDAARVGDKRSMNVFIAIRSFRTFLDGN